MPLTVTVNTIAERLRTYCNSLGDKKKTYVHLSDRKVTVVVDTPVHRELECSAFDCNVTVHIV